MTPLTLLLDLDDTLLNTNLQAFVPAYFQALAKELAPRIAPDTMLRALLSGMNRMSESQDFNRTLREVFEEEFHPRIGIPREELEADIERFYDRVFPTLQTLTSPNPEAIPFVEWAAAQGFRIAIATDPLLPSKATNHRLRWAGFEPGQFEVVSTMDDFHFSKTHPAYYAEILGRMGWHEGPVLMVGNDLERDILPAKRLGLAAFLVNGEPASGSEGEADFHGSLRDLRLRLEAMNDLSVFIPNFKSREAVRSALMGTPAALNGMLGVLDEGAWKRKPSAEDWTITELACHLRDTEREIHQMQIRLFAEREEPFIPRPDTSVWANQRDYAHEDGREALKKFIEYRRETLAMLASLPDEAWDRKARHAIFGPTNFCETIGFMADHDRLHLHQAWTLLKRI